MGMESLVASLVAATSLVAFADIQINEALVNPPGGDNDVGFEFIELINPTANSIDLSAYTLIVLDGDGTNQFGNVDVFFPLSGTIAPNGGVWVLAQDYSEFGLASGTPGWDRATLGMPTGGFWTVSSGNQDFENGTLTFLLVKNVVVNDTINGSTDFDPLNDGSFNVPASMSFDPNTDVVDSMSWTDNGSADKEYAFETHGKRYGYPSTFTPDAFAKIIGVGDRIFRLNNLTLSPPFDITPNEAWRYPSFSGQYVMTPGAPNTMLGPPTDGDTNGDGCVDDLDLTAVILDFGGPPSGSNGDTDVDNTGTVDDADITTVILNYGNGC